MTRRASTRLVDAAVVVLVAMLAAGCSSAVAPSASPTTVDGHTYLSTAVDGVSLVPGTRVRLTFAGDSLTATAGCNTMGGPYAIDGHRLATGQLSMTEMGCDPRRQQQDAWLARLLGDATVEFRGDTLTISDGRVRLTLLDEQVATPDQPLEGTSWVLDGIRSGDAVSSVPTGVTAAIQILGGLVQVNAGCNTRTGTAVASAGATPPTITFGAIAVTKLACEPGAMAVETAILSILDGTVGYSIDADRLTLTKADHGLTFRATGCAHCRP